jgi:hypothetical protein
MRRLRRWLVRALGLADVDRWRLFDLIAEYARARYEKGVEEGKAIAGGLRRKAGPGEGGESGDYGVADPRTPGGTVWYTFDSPAYYRAHRKACEEYGKLLDALDLF